MAEARQARTYRTLAQRASSQLPARPRLESLTPWLIAAITSAGLYFGRSVLIPIILAVLLSFLLSPIVAGLRHAKLPRPVAVLSAVALAIAGIATTSAIIVTQAATLTKDAPLYAERITGKASILRANLQQRFGVLLRETPEGGSGHRTALRARRESARMQAAPAQSTAIPVEVREAPPSALEELRAYVIPAFVPIETALIVLVVTIFILLQRDDLRDRLIRLMGAADLHRTTLALDDGAKRLSRYFLSQSLVNCGFGTVIWAGLFLLGVPSPGLWGILAGLLRFIPYVGTIVASLGPLALAAAVSPGWEMVIWVALLFVLIEPIVGYVVEPLLYGHSTGLSPVSVVIAALFMNWIWWPIGLVLDMPLTLILVVLGQHIPAIEIFDILLGDRPALSPAETFYQRALAGHADDALDQAESLLETQTLAAYYDDVILAGLRLAVADVDRGAVKRSDLRAVCDTTIEVLGTLADHHNTGTQTATLQVINPRLASAIDGQFGRGPDNRVIICVPGRGPLDLPVAMMAAQLLRRAGFAVREQARDQEPGDHRAELEHIGADTVCILGLFDQRSFRRLQPVVQRVRAANVLIGVQRSGEAANADHVGQGLLASLTALVDAL